MVGAWLVKELLAEGASVVALVRDADPRSELFRSGDIAETNVVNGALEDLATQERALNEYEIDTVFHLGAQAIVGVAQRSPVATFEANIRGTYNVLEACRLHRRTIRRVVVASSDKAYGEGASLPYTESMEVAGKYPYEVSKSCADLLARSYYSTYDIPVAIARCGNIYGGGDINFSRIVPGTIGSFLRGERPIIRSDGTYVRDYFYVKDAARAYMLLALNLENAGVRGEAFNFSLESPMTVLDLVAQIQRLMHATGLPPDIRNEATGEIHSQHLCALKARERLSWKPEYGLHVGLEETIAWYRQFFVQNKL